MKLACAALESVYEVLHRTYGVQAWWPADSTFEVMVGAILTQRTSWHNVELALANLRAGGLLDPGALRGAAPSVLLRAVRPAGYYRQKAARLSALSAWLEDRGGIAGVATLSDAALREELLAIKGIGPETADAISLYAFRRPFFVIDTYTRRLFSRIGMIDGSEPYEVLREFLESTLGGTAASYGEYHALIVAHGKEHCRVEPHCESCALGPQCGYRRELIAAALR